MSNIKALSLTSIPVDNVPLARPDATGLRNNLKMGLDSERRSATPRREYDVNPLALSFA